jgi:hypothetical protein
MSTSEFTGRPRVAKGSLWIYEDQTFRAQPSRRIYFQYNPESLRRAFAVRAPARDPSQSSTAHEDVLSVPGPPVETISMTVELDAADQLEDPSHRDQVNESGLRGALAALELLLYPNSQRLQQIEDQAQRGAVDVHPADTPLTVLHWGASTPSDATDESSGNARIVPVQLQTLSITEELFDPALNPIVAKAELTLKVLTYMEFTRQSVGRETFIAHQKKLEELAQQWVGG